MGLKRTGRKGGDLRLERDGKERREGVVRCVKERERESESEREKGQSNLKYVEVNLTPAVYLVTESCSESQVSSNVL